MKTVYILKSELDESLLIDCTNNLKKEIKPFLKTKKVGKIKMTPWDLLCSIDFKKDRHAENLVKFLRSKEGKDFIINHLARNPLSELEKLMTFIPKSCPFYVIGGLAIDGYIGKLSRIHNDTDLLCWRKDVEKVKKAIRKIGYKVKSYYLKDDKNKVHYIETEEENPIISFLIMDKMPNKSFEISVGKNYHMVFPEKYLDSKKVMISDIAFPVVKLELLDFLNKKAKANLSRIKKENPKLYSMLGSKIVNSKHDRIILNNILKNNI